MKNPKIIVTDNRTEYYLRKQGINDRGRLSWKVGIPKQDLKFRNYE